MAKASGAGLRSVPVKGGKEIVSADTIYRWSWQRFGDFEIDTMIGKNHKGAIVTTNDRCTHLVLIRRLAGKEATQPASTVIEALLPYKDKIHTITADNGKEFARHKEIAKGLDAEFYFARPYHSWERGANENTNGLIRLYLYIYNYLMTVRGIAY